MVDELANKYSGPVLVCGSAPCLFRDMDKALRARPDATIIAINDVAGYINAEFVTSIHCEKMQEFRAKSINKKIKTLSGGIYNAACDVDHWFSSCNSGGTSAGSALKIARKMGFDEIILCGCPMNGGDGYFYRRAKPTQFLMQKRFGDASPRSSSVVAHQMNLRYEMEGNGYNMVKSMSGFTAELFGKPDFMEPLYDN